MSRRANDYLANEVAKRPDRFQDFAALPMQNPQRAAAELERCARDLGFLGEQMLLAAKLPGQAPFFDLVRYHTKRLAQLGINIELKADMSDAMLAASDVDAIAIATGASPRRPDIAGLDDPRICNMWQVLRGEAMAEQNVAIVVQEDHVAPLALADMLGREGRSVTLFIQTSSPAPLFSRYTMGTLLARLSEVSAKLIFNEVVTAITLPSLHSRHVYSQHPSVHHGFDSVVLACGAVPEAALFDRIDGQRDDMHLLGDAYAPRRIVFATQQGYQLATRI